MRIGVDATCWANTRGYGRFARELVSALAQQSPDDEFICIGDQQSLDAHTLSAPNVVRHPVALSTTPSVAAAADGARSIQDMLALTRAVRMVKPQVFFSPSVYTYFPLPPGQRAVVTVHDAIAERFPHLTLPSARARLFWNLKVRLALWQSRLVLTVSEYAARDIERVLKVPRERIRVALEAPASTYTPSKHADVVRIRTTFDLRQAPYFVYVGGFNPHKRVDAVIRAHARVVGKIGASAPRLVLVGRLSGDVFHGEGERLRSLISELGSTDWVHWTGYVPDEDLRHLHSGATAVVLASESEGFGLPAVEGAACGAPVIATTESPLPQILAGAGIFVAPGSVDEIEAAMRLLLGSPETQRAMATQALVCASALSWSAAAKATSDALHEAAA